MYQKVIIIGNLGGDPEMRYMPDGTAVTNFSVATNRRWVDKQTNQVVDETTWFRVSVWGRQAETANQYLTRGKKVLVEGVLQPDKNTGGPRMYTRQDGSVGSSFEIRADNVRFLPSGSDEGGASGGGHNSQQAAVAQETDEIPF